MKYIIYLLTFFSIFYLQAQTPSGFFSGSIYYNNGNKEDVYIKKFNSDDSKITIQSINNDHKKAETKKIKSEDLSSIEININNEKPLIFKKLKVCNYNLLGKIKCNNGELWASKTYSTDKIESYIFYTYVFTGRQNNRNNIIHYVNLAIKVPDFDGILFIGVSGKDKTIDDPFNAYDKQFRKILAEFCKEKCPNIVKNIEDKKYNRQDLDTFINDFTTMCE
jgi:hypothetical protein